MRRQAGKQATGKQASRQAGRRRETRDERRRRTKNTERRTEKPTRKRQDKQKRRVVTGGGGEVQECSRLCGAELAWWGGARVGDEYCRLDAGCEDGGQPLERCVEERRRRAREVAQRRKVGMGAITRCLLGAVGSKPLLTKSATSMFIVGSGDMLCQGLLEDGPFDVKRLCVFTFLGGALIGPALHLWYGTLNRIIPQQTTAGALKRLALDQFVFAGPFIATFMSSALTLNGRPEQILQLKKEWLLRWS